MTIVTAVFRLFLAFFLLSFCATGQSVQDECIVGDDGSCLPSAATTEAVEAAAECRNKHDLCSFWKDSGEVSHWKQ